MAAHISLLDIEILDVSLTGMVSNKWDGEIGNEIQIRLWDINQYNFTFESNERH